ncbi:MAG TPA: hypothetical protein DEP23_11420 [Ruminococcaceae bacterium]|nr:hypothetical protein [Oscillospiraceae bacterium]
MSYISDIFNRLHIQQIREFLLHGVEEINISDKSYKERIDEAAKPVIEVIRQKFLDTEGCEELINMIYHCTSIYEEVYMEIGLQCGLMLAVEILGNSQTDK